MKKNKLIKMSKKLDNYQDLNPTIEFQDNNIRMKYFLDGSGELMLNESKYNNFFHREDGGAYYQLEYLEKHMEKCLKEIEICKRAYKIVNKSILEINKTIKKLEKKHENKT